MIDLPSQLDAEPFAAIGPFRLGMTREQAIDLFGEPMRWFRRVASGAETASYRQSGAQVFLTFDPGADVVSHIEITEPMGVRLAGDNVLGRPVADVVARLLAAEVRVDLVYEPGLVGIKLPALGVSCFVDVGVVMSVSIEQLAPEPGEG